LLSIFAKKFIVMSEETIWIHPDTITGPPAEDDKYFHRQYINDEFWREVNKGSHILFIAPRRVGKTSIMINIQKTSDPDWHCLYENIEGIKTQSQFFKKLFDILVDQLGTLSKSKEKFTTWLKGRGIDEISMDGKVKVSKREINFKDELLALIKELKNIDHRVVLFLDEFPEVISSIKKNEGIEEAVDTLHTIRSIRQDKNFCNCILVLAGSIGLHQIVESLDRLHLINDLYPLRVNSLNENEAILFIEQLTRGATMKIDDKTLKYLILKINHLLPYYIQLMIAGCDDILFMETRPLLQSDDVDKAFAGIIKQNEYLSDWDTRLRRYNPKNIYQYCLYVLTKCAHTNKISVQELYNSAIKFKLQDKFMSIIKMLERDGYIIEDKQNYRFLSPILQEWWKLQHPIF